MKKMNKSEIKKTRPTIELIADDQLEHVVGARNYGWEQGGWVTLLDPVPGPTIPKP